MEAEPEDGAEDEVALFKGKVAMILEKSFSPYGVLSLKTSVSTTHPKSRIVLMMNALTR